MAPTKAAQAIEPATLSSILLFALHLAWNVIQFICSLGPIYCIAYILSLFHCYFKQPPSRKTPKADTVMSVFWVLLAAHFLMLMWMLLGVFDAMTAASWTLKLTASVLTIAAALTACAVGAVTVFTFVALCQTAAAALGISEAQPFLQPEETELEQGTSQAQHDEGGMRDEGVEGKDAKRAD
ncbi:hypothetical protein MBLNU459_g6379t1 [Dothideomycetes sp. NU459]